MPILNSCVPFRQLRRPRTPATRSAVSARQASANVAPVVAMSSTTTARRVPIGRHPRRLRNECAMQIRRPFGRAQTGRVQDVAGQRQRGRERAAVAPRRARGQSQHVITAACPRCRATRRHRYEHRCTQRRRGLGQQRREWTGQVAAAAFLVGQQCRPCTALVGRCRTEVHGLRPSRRVPSRPRTRHTAGHRRARTRRTAEAGRDRRSQPPSRAGPSAKPCWRGVSRDSAGAALWMQPGLWIACLTTIPRRPDRSRRSCRCQEWPRFHPAASIPSRPLTPRQGHRRPP